MRWRERLYDFDGLPIDCFGRKCGKGRPGAEEVRRNAFCNVYAPFGLLCTYLVILREVEEEKKPWRMALTMFPTDLFFGDS